MPGVAWARERVSCATQADFAAAASRAPTLQATPASAATIPGVRNGFGFPAACAIAPAPVRLRLHACATAPAPLRLRPCACTGGYGFTRGAQLRPISPRRHPGPEIVGNTGARRRDLRSCEPSCGPHQPRSPPLVVGMPRLPLARRRKPISWLLPDRLNSVHNSGCFRPDGIRTPVLLAHLAWCRRIAGVVHAAEAGLGVYDRVCRIGRAPAGGHAGRIGRAPAGGQRGRMPGGRMLVAALL